MTKKTKAGGKLALSDFQRATAQHAFRRLYHDHDSTRRFLVADETGLGKTHVAKEIISLAVSHLQQVDRVLNASTSSTFARTLKLRLRIFGSLITPDQRLQALLLD